MILRFQAMLWNIRSLGLIVFWSIGLYVPYRVSCCVPCRVRGVACGVSRRIIVLLELQFTATAAHGPRLPHCPTADSPGQARSLVSRSVGVASLQNEHNCRYPPWGVPTIGQATIGQASPRIPLYTIRSIFDDIGQNRVSYLSR